MWYDRDGQPDTELVGAYISVDLHTRTIEQAEQLSDRRWVDWHGSYSYRRATVGSTSIARRTAM